jgi:hypothetical protein
MQFLRSDYAHYVHADVLVCVWFPNYVSLSKSRTGATSNPHFASIPLRLVRSYEKAPDSTRSEGSGGRGFVIRFNITNVAQQDVEIGALGIAMPSAGMQVIWSVMCDVVTTLTEQKTSKQCN